MTPRTNGVLSLLVVTLLLAATSPCAPIVCLSGAHTQVEVPFASCCGHRAASSDGPAALLEAAPAECGDCDDMPWVSAYHNDSPQANECAQPGPAAYALPPAITGPDVILELGGPVTSVSFPAGALPRRC